MKLLLSNDDGISAVGIRALAQALSQTHEVYISAPASQQSAVSRAMTLYDPLRADAVPFLDLPEGRAYAVTGTPVDCVRLGLGNLFSDIAFDMVLSGINIGPNVGSDTLYSGTVAAAHEAALLGYPSIALSCCSMTPQHMETSAAVAVKMAAYLAAHPLPFGTLLNVNVPDVPLSELRGVRAVPMCRQEYQLDFIERRDPKGRAYYWPPRHRTGVFGEELTDEPQIRAGYVTVTPIGYDLTAYETLQNMKKYTNIDSSEDFMAWKA